MNWELLTKVLDQLPNNTAIVPFFRGEPTLYPRFEDALLEMRRFREVQLATNGDKLSQQNRSAMLKFCTFVSISLHNFVYPTQTKNGILTFLYDALGNGVETQISIIDSLIPPKQKKRFVSQWLDHVDQVRIYVEHSHRGYGDIVEHVASPVVGNHHPCVKPFTEMVVYWDGKVALCCHDWNNPCPLGDLNCQTVEEVWCGEAYEDVRYKHSHGKRREVPSCQNCDQWIASYMPKKMLGELYTNG